MSESTPSLTHCSPFSGNVPGAKKLVQKMAFEVRRLFLFGSNGSRYDCDYFGCISTVVNIIRINMDACYYDNKLCLFVSWFTPYSRILHRHGRWRTELVNVFFLWHGISFFAISPKGPPHLVAVGVTAFSLLCARDDCCPRCENL